MVDQRAVRASDVLCDQRIANRRTEGGQLSNMTRFERAAMLGDEEKPVTAPRDIAGQHAITGHLDAHGLAVTVGRHIAHGDAAVRIERGLDDANRRFDPVLTGPDAPHMRQRHHESDRAVSAHAEVADVVEEDHAGRAIGGVRLAQQRAHHDVRAARLRDDAGAPVVEAAAEYVEPFGQRPAAEIGATGHNQAGRFTAGVRINHVQGFHAAMLETRAQPVLASLCVDHDDFSIVSDAASKVSMATTPDCCAACGKSRPRLCPYAGKPLPPRCTATCVSASKAAYSLGIRELCSAIRAHRLC